MVILLWREIKQGKWIGSLGVAVVVVLLNRMVREGLSKVSEKVMN